MKADYWLKISKARWLKYPVLGMLVFPLAPLASFAANGENVGVAVVQQNNTRTLVGQVVDDEMGDPIIGANILISETKTGVITDIDGRFSVQIPMKGATLVISYVGYQTQTIKVTDQGVLNLRMKSDEENLREVVVVGAGTQKKISVTGAVTNIEGSRLYVPSSSLTSGLGGKLAGVVSRVNSGEPGSTSEFYIRGKSTFGGGNTPLIILDGVEISTGDLDRVPPETIESFSILKDASATAIYGSRGANGVMVITTKSGIENQSTRVNVTVENSFVRPKNMVEVVDGATWREYYNRTALARGREVAPYSQEAIEYTRSGKYPYAYPDVDWLGLMFKDMNMNQRANLNISGGGNRATYYMSVQANHDTGIFDIPKTYSFNNNINRWNYNFQSNIDYKLSPSTKLSLRMNAQIGDNAGNGTSTDDMFAKVFHTNPVTYPAYFPAQEGDDHIRFGSSFSQGVITTGNPYAEMLSKYTQANYSTLNISLILNQQLDFLLKGLSFRGLVNMKNWSQQTFNRTIDPYFYAVQSGSWVAGPDGTDSYTLQTLHTGNAYVTTDDGTNKGMDRTIYIDAQLNYNNTFNKVHNVTGMLMYMQREFRNSPLPNRQQGLSGRFTYDYDRRYLVEFNFGYNGTERLADGSRFEFFPAASVGWVASGEKFWQPIEKVVNFFKIRGSYGVVGNSSMDGPHFLFDSEINATGLGGFNWGTLLNNGKNGPIINNFAVANASWQRVYKLDIGVDIELFNQLKVTADYFDERTKKIMMQRASFPRILGYMGKKPYANIGEARNRGFDLAINWQKEIVKDLRADLRFNMTYNLNEMVYKDEPAYPYTWQATTGLPMDYTMGYICEGMFTSQEEIDHWPNQSSLGSGQTVGDLKYRDVNGDGMISDLDRVVISPYGTDPRLQWGVGLNLVYKKWDLGMFFNGSGKRTIMVNNMRPFEEDGYNTASNLPTYIAEDCFNPEDPNFDASYPLMGIEKNQYLNNNQPSTYWMRDGKFVRFKTLELGYRFNHCRVYMSGDNLAVWSPFKLWDPELDAWNKYPLSTTITIGAQLNF